MKIVLLNIAVAVLLALSIASCGKKSGGVDQKAADACAVNDKSNPASEDGDACKTCCEKAGTSGYMWMLGKGCKCQ